MPPPRRRPAVLIAACLAVCVTLLVAAAPALAVRPPIHAHRGGPLEFGKPVYGENTLPAFRASALRGFVLEMDVKLTRDRVPVVIHDPTARPHHALHRPGERAHARRPAGQLPVGHHRHRRQLRAARARTTAAARRSPSWPRCSRWRGFTGARVNLEIKNQPGDPDFDNTPAFANAVLDVVERSGFPPSRLIVQSFWFPNLDVTRQRLPDVERSLLIVGALEPGFCGPARRSLDLTAVARQPPRVHRQGAPAGPARGALHARHRRGAPAAAAGRAWTS